ncbi:hypothetical protein IVB02_21365 [Bradyrhizobium sp. 166]|uniref:hypothetical protein n=1 Tax=Bradyrhizobium sp. 166 TaxID=2782638 RepID=UPI001FF979B6|nr:hypothetical protein [Bradyrhizobium sp. 166]MCK1603916.1 hypothetical protein [Bradyrhizobium sp. 166]
MKRRILNTLLSRAAVAGRAIQARLRKYRVVPSHTTSNKRDDTTEFTIYPKTSVPTLPLNIKKVSVYRERTNNLDTPQGRADAYRNLADEIYHSARQMPEDSTAQQILIFHVLELALKGYLIHTGLKEEQLSKRPYSHNLINAYAEAKRRGLRVSLAGGAEPHDIILGSRGAGADLDKVDLIINWANEFHDRGVLRYSVASALLPTCLDVFPIIDEVLKAIPNGDD